MNPDLKKLIRLQSVDLSIEELSEKVERFPAISKALDEKLHSANTRLQKARERSKGTQATRKKLEGEVSSMEAKIAKYRDQLMSVKTNDEYRALLKEIEYLEAAIRKTEDEILNLMLETENIEREVKSAGALLKEDQQLVETERRQLEEENRRDRDSLDAYSKERKEIEHAVSPDVLSQYERIRRARRGVAVAQAREEACALCNVRIRPQVFQEIRKNDQIITCDSCTRILYDPENMDHPFEVA